MNGRDRAGGCRPHSADDFYHAEQLAHRDRRFHVDGLRFTLEGWDLQGYSVLSNACGDQPLLISPLQKTLDVLNRLARRLHCPSAQGFHGGPDCQHFSFCAQKEKCWQYGPPWKPWAEGQCSRRARRLSTSSVFCNGDIKRG